MYTATPETIEHIVLLVEHARPEWEPALVRIILNNLASQVDGSALAVAAIRAANDPDMPSPKAIGWRGKHWEGLWSAPPEVQGGPRCDVCEKTEARCYGERPGPDDHVFTPRPREESRR